MSKWTDNLGRVRKLGSDPGIVKKMGIGRRRLLGVDRSK
jgi:hypothetical protein